MHSWAIVAGGLGFIFLMNCLGAASVFLFGKTVPPRVQQVSLGFAAGVMIAAAIWGLLLPAEEVAKELGMAEWLPLAGGFLIGVLLLLGLDRLIPHLHPLTSVAEGPASMSKSTTLLVSAMTLHNIPEGIAVGLALALAAQGGGGPEMYAGAIALALAIGIHNTPESAAVSLALRQEGNSRLRAFVIASVTGSVQVVFGILAVLLAMQIGAFMPWLLAFAAGAMMYVVVEELIPHAHPDRISAGAAHSNAGTLGAMAGFLLMMVLDMAMH